MINLFLLVVPITLTHCSTTKSKNLNCPRETDLIRLQEFQKISEKLGEAVWDTWNKVPAAILLIDEQSEYLFNQNVNGHNFSKTCSTKFYPTIYSRPRTFDKNLLASFPAFEMLPTIVIGTPENTHIKSSLAWLGVMAHEHFHQIQYTQPSYYSEVEKLKPASIKANDAQWMLNYNFPYENVQFNLKIKKLSQSLLTLYQKTNKANFKKYLKIRQDFLNQIGTDNSRYYEFQLWQEGIARYIQIKWLRVVKDRFNFSVNFKSLDKSDPSTIYEETLQNTLEDLKVANLKKRKRSLFYSIGAIEGLVLDKLYPTWKTNYFSNIGKLGIHFTSH